MKHSPGQLYQRTFRKTKQINLVIDHCKYHNKKLNVWQTYGFRDPWLFNSLTDCYETGMHSVSKFSLARFLSSHWHTHTRTHTFSPHSYTVSFSLTCSLHCPAGMCWDQHYNVQKQLKALTGQWCMEGPNRTKFRTSKCSEIWRQGTSKTRPHYRTFTSTFEELINVQFMNSPCSKCFEKLMNPEISVMLL